MTLLETPLDAESTTLMLLKSLMPLSTALTLVHLEPMSAVPGAMSTAT